MNVFQDVVVPTLRAGAAGGLGSGPLRPKPPGQPVEPVEADPQEGIRQPGEQKHRKRVTYFTVEEASCLDSALRPG